MILLVIGVLVKIYNLGRVYFIFYFIFYYYFIIISIIIINIICFVFFFLPFFFFFFFILFHFDLLTIPKTKKYSGLQVPTMYLFSFIFLCMPQWTQDKSRKFKGGIFCDGHLAVTYGGELLYLRIFS